LRICLVNTFHYLRGGDSTCTFDLARLLTDHGDSVAHFAMKHPANIRSEFEQYFVNHIDYAALRASRNPASRIKGLVKSLYSFEARRKFASLLNATCPDVVHLQNFRRHLTFSIVPQARKRGIPVVQTAHDCEAFCPNSLLFARGRVCEACKGGHFYKALLLKCKDDALVGSLAVALEGYFVRIRHYYRLIDRVIAPSEFLKRKMVENGFAPEKVVVVNNFVFADDFRPANTSGDYVVYSGRLSPEKGLATLIDAARSIPRTKVLVVGEGPSLGELKALKEQLGASNVQFMGRLERHQLIALVAESKFVVLPSICAENYPYALLEAFAVAKPAIGSRLGGIPEMITDGVTGFLADPGDPQALGEKMAYLDAHPDLAREMGVAARRRVEEELGPEVHYGKMKQVYREVSR
jgi:glycosyltransferase involved in cell wall biosynthesis